MKKIISLFALCIPFLSYANSEHTEPTPYTTTYFFGDSLTDAHLSDNDGTYTQDWNGNNKWGTNAEAKRVGSPYTSATIENENSDYRPLYPNYLVSDFPIVKGALLPMRMAKALGVNPHETNINYAYAGAETSDDFSTDLSPVIPYRLNNDACTEAGLINNEYICVPGLLKQIRIYLDDTPDHMAKEDALYVLWAGGNDIKNDPLDTEKTITAAKNVVSAIRMLLEHNAKEENIIVIDMPDMGTIPLVNNNILLSLLMTELSSLFNKTLASNLEQYPNIHFISAFDTLNSLLTGNLYTNIIDACTGDKTSLPACDGYVWWDTIHPTSEVHKALAEMIFDTLTLTN